MIDTHFNLFDAAVIGIMALSCIFAFFRGIVREVLSLFAWIGAGIFALHYYPVASEALKAHFKSPVTASVMAIVGLYIGALIVFAIINRIIIKTIKGGGDGGMLDNLLGLMFGALRGALIISLAYFLISVTLPEKRYPDWLKNSVTRPYAEQGAVTLVHLAPDYLREISSLEKKATVNLQTDKNTPRESDAEEEKAEDTGYSQSSKRELDRLVDSFNHKQP